MQRVVFHEKIPVFLVANKFLPPKEIWSKNLQQVKIFIQKKLLSTTKTWKKKKKNSFDLNFEFLKLDIEQES